MGSYVFCFHGYISRSEIAILFKTYTLVFPDSSVGKESTCNVGDAVSIPGSGKCLGVGNGNPVAPVLLPEKILWTGEAGGLQSMASQSRK